MTSTAVGLQPKFVYGLRATVKGNIHFLENQSIVYPVAGVIAIHDYKNHKQTFLRLAEDYEPTVIAISPNRKLLAIAEWNDVTKMYVTTMNSTFFHFTFFFSLLKIMNDKMCNFPK